MPSQTMRQNQPHTLAAAAACAPVVHQGTTALALALALASVALLGLGLVAREPVWC